MKLFAARRIASRSGAEDVAQETLRRALEALRAGRVENPEALPAFLFQTARHICMHENRSGGREARAMARFATSASESGGASPDALRELISEERRASVRKALDRLRPADRDLLWWMYGEALEAGAIAARLGIEPGAVRVRKHRALGRLAEALGEPEDVTISVVREHIQG
ncbi:MAG: sigma-70 family RNA polymerase sigma factor [Acidobacteriota bacterium]|nr:sigma-70 family RNA polymerase sigma factor [Acidobacteriota bacterium]